MKIQKGDTVIVITGKEKGKKAKVLRTMPKKELIVLEKINIVTKHVKKRGGNPGEIIKFEAPIHVSNVMVLDPEKDKGTRIGYKVAQEGKKDRIAQKSKKVLDTESFKK